MNKQAEPDGRGEDWRRSAAEELRAALERLERDPAAYAAGQLTRGLRQTAEAVVGSLETTRYLRDVQQGVRALPHARFEDHDGATYNLGVAALVAALATGEEDRARLTARIVKPLAGLAEAQLRGLCRELLFFAAWAAATGGGAGDEEIVEADALEEAFAELRQELEGESGAGPSAEPIPEPAPPPVAKPAAKARPASPRER